MLYSIKLVLALSEYLFAGFALGILIPARLHDPETELKMCRQVCDAHRPADAFSTMWSRFSLGLVALSPFVMKRIKPKTHAFQTGITRC